MMESHFLQLFSLWDYLVNSWWSNGRKVLFNLCKWIQWLAGWCLGGWVGVELPLLYVCTLMILAFNITTCSLYSLFILQYFLLDHTENLMCLCLYVPVSNVDHNEFEYFETNGLPSEIKSVFKLSLFLPSHELTTYRTWKKVWMNTCFALIIFDLLSMCLSVIMLWPVLTNSFCQMWNTSCFSNSN